MLTAVGMNAFLWMFSRDRDSIIALKTTVKMSYLTSKHPSFLNRNTRCCASMYTKSVCRER